MHLKKIHLIAILLLMINHLSAQQNFVISGHISDASTGEDLPGASIVVEGSSTSGTATNSYGFYSLTLPAGNYRVRYQYVGYEPQLMQVELNGNRKTDIELVEKTFELGNIVVTGERADRNITSVEMGNVKLAPKQIEKIPVIFGEQDILKTMQLTPGICKSSA